MTTPSHPQSLLSRVKRTLVDDCAVRPGDPIAVAVSGGVDSMALLHCLVLLRKKLDFRLLALSVDHGLRPEARDEVQLVGRSAQGWQVEFLPISLGLEAGSNVHARARKARYSALWDAARQHLGSEALLATAHHKDDRAETVLLRLLRGTSLEGLGVLPARQDRLIRPMIAARRSDAEQHAARHQIPYVDDPSNVDPRFLRTRVRHELLPLFERLGPGAVDRLAALAEEAMHLPAPLALKREHREQLRRAVHDPQCAVDLRLPGGLRLLRERDPK